MERSTQYTSFSSRKQPANAGTERKQFTENASVALQQPILTHAHTKCPPVERLWHSTKWEDAAIVLVGFQNRRIGLLEDYY